MTRLPENHGQETAQESTLLRWLLAALICTLGSYALLRLFHGSWHSGTPVLDPLTPLITAFGSLGRSFKSFFSQPPFATLVIVVALLAALIGFLRQRRMELIPLVLALGILGSAQVCLIAHKFALFYNFSGIAFGAALAGLWFLNDRDLSVADGIRRPRMWMALIIVVAVIFRFFQLDLVPGVSSELSGYVVNLSRFVDGPRNVLVDHFLEDRPLSYMGNAATMLVVLYLTLFGFTPLAVHLMTATAGVLCVVALFFLTRKLFGTRVALTACFLMAISPWHTFYSRTGSAGIHAALTVLQTTLVYYVLVTAFEKRSSLLFGLLGFLLGLSVYLYELGKITFAGVGLFGLVLLVRRIPGEHIRANIQSYGKHVAAAVIVCAVTLTPYLRAGLNDRSYFYAAQGPIAFKKLFWEAESAAAPSAGTVISTNLKHLVPILTHRRMPPPIGGGTTGSHFGDRKKGLLDPVTASCLLLGVALAIRNFRKEAYLLLLVWGITAAAPSLMTSALPRRLTLMMPPLFICAGLGANMILGTFAGAWPRLAGRRLLNLAAIGSLVLVFVSVQLRDFFEETTYSSQLHPSFVRYHKELSDVIATSDVYTDIGHSILRFVTAGGRNPGSEETRALPPRPYEVRRDLSRRILAVLGAAQTGTKDLSFVLSGHTKDNRKLADSLQKLTPGSSRFDTDAFTIVTLPRRDLDGALGFAPAEPRPAKQAEPNASYVHRGVLLVPSAGRYRLEADAGVLSILIDGHEARRPAVKATDEFQLLAGAHELSVHSNQMSSPQLVWTHLDPDTQAAALPFVWKPSIRAIEELRGHPSRWAEIGLVPEGETILGSPGSLVQPRNLWIAENGNIYVADRVQARVFVFGRDGNEISSFPTGMAPLMAMPDAQGNVYVVGTQMGLTRYTPDGEPSLINSARAMDMRWDASANLLLLTTGGSVFAVDPDTGEILRQAEFPAPGAMDLGPDGSLYLLSGNAKLHRLGPDLGVVSKVQIDPHALGRDLNRVSQAAVDDAGRLYLTDHWNDTVRVFDRDGTELVGTVGEMELPLTIRRPWDVLFHQKKLHVLHYDRLQLKISVYRIQE